MQKWKLTRSVPDHTLGKELGGVSPTAGKRYFNALDSHYRTGGGERRVIEKRSRSQQKERRKKKGREI